MRRRRARRARPTRPGDATARREGARKRRRGEGEGEDDGGEGADDAVAARLTAGDDDGVRATCDEACENDRGAATGSGDAGDSGVLEANSDALTGAPLGSLEVVH
jgi:hypothetical protein